MCKHWIELDSESGQLYEYCRGARKKCTCSGAKKQCDFPSFYEEEKGDNCTRCGKKAILTEFVHDDDESEYLCPNCWGYWEVAQDREYEEWKETHNEKGEEIC